MHARPTFRERPSNGRVGAECAEQLDVRRADREQHLLHALISDALAMGRRDADEPFVVRDRLLEVADGDPDVIDVGERDHRAAPATGCIFAMRSRAAATWYAGRSSARATAATPCARRSASGFASAPRGASRTKNETSSRNWGRDGLIAPRSY